MATWSGVYPDELATFTLDPCSIKRAAKNSKQLKDCEEWFKIKHEHSGLVLLIYKYLEHQHDHKMQLDVWHIDRHGLWRQRFYIHISIVPTQLGHFLQPWHDAVNSRFHAT